AHQSDDLIHVIRFARQRLDTETSADGILSCKEALRERLIHNGDLRRPHAVVIVKVAPGEERRAHGFEIAWTGAIEPRLFASGAGWVIIGMRHVIPPSAAEWGKADGRR